MIVVILGIRYFMEVIILNSCVIFGFNVNMFYINGLASGIFVVVFITKYGNFVRKFFLEEASMCQFVLIGVILFIFLNNYGGFRV